MSRLLTNIIEFFGALWVLLILGIQSRFNMRSSYWNWRQNTAFPNNQIPPGHPSKPRLTLEYARWAYRIRRLR